MGGWIIRTGGGISLLAITVLIGHGTSPLRPLHNRGDLALSDAVINEPVHSPAGTSITVAGEVAFNGLFHGAARFHGRGTAVFNGGSSPGDSPAVVSFEGGVRFGPPSTLTIELGATTPGAYDRLEVQGAFEAGGTLVAVLLPGFAGTVGDSYEIVEAGSVTGMFTYVPPSIGQGLALALDQTATSIRLTVAVDCNGNAVPDTQEIAQNPGQDCDGNLALDVCDIAGGAGDSNANGHLDTCEVCLLDVVPAALSWTPPVNATTFDVIGGDLATLRSTSGDFTAATQECLSDNQTGTSLPLVTDPTPGSGVWFLVRGVASGVILSFDTFTSSQAGSRDAEIAASAAACP